MENTFLPYTGKIELSYEYPFMEDDMKERARELLTAQGLSTVASHDLAHSIRYSLGHSQGDGVSFSSGTLSNGDLEQWIPEAKGDLVFRIYTIDSRYVHENTFRVECLSEELDQVESARMENIILHRLQEICKYIEKYGYELMEAEDRYDRKREAWKKFCALNNIESDSGAEAEAEDIWTYLYYSDEPKEGFTLIYDGKEYDKVYAKLPEVERKSRTVEYLTLRSLRDYF